MIANARGMLRHYFYGEYSAGIALVFDTALAAQAAAMVLSAPWKVAEKNPLVLTWHSSSEALKVVKERFASLDLQIPPCGRDHCRHQCEDAEIDSINHSIDVGPAFTLAIECVDPRQVTMF